MINAIPILLTLALLVTLGCSSPCRAPLLDVPNEVIDRAVDEAADDPLFESVDWITQQWWALFEDPQLAEFIEAALVNYPDIHAAQAQILAAQWNADRAKASLFPNITWTGDVLREKFSKTGLITPPSNSANENANPNIISREIGAAIPAESGSVPFYFTQYETALNLAFDFDIWGKNREAWKGALSLVQANIADQAFVHLNLSLAVAETYFRLQIDYQRQAIANEIIRNREAYLKLIENRIQHNIENDISFNNIALDLARTKQILLQIQEDIVINEHQLRAYLAGNFDDEIQTVDAAKPLPPIPLPREIPMHLLAHRPDISRQLWIIESAGHEIEVAKAGFFPDFNLLAFFGFQTIHFKKWFWGKSSYWAVNPAFSLPIFDGGVLLSDLRSSEVQYDLAIFEYNRLVRQTSDG
jgi:NodT family efflux transporter outer membrane factor (OMF) lipoprotein